MKRLFDFWLSLFGLIITSPILIPVIFLVWLQDFHSPFYIAPRVSKGNGIYKMFKLRSMIVDADKTGVDSTSVNDNRITSIGNFIRKFKLDELSQLINVVKGDMSFVGPRPNVKRETDLYSDVEKKLLTIRPGITDISSIVFSDEGEILAGKDDPDLAYNQLIRPWKSRLGIIYIENQSLFLDIQLIFLTIVVIFSKKRVLKSINALLIKYNVDKELIEVCKRENELYPYPPPGKNKIIENRG
jgi:lipopolysaccharide/colanic/teichoic acid biosynthesis glycosyltransferase